MTIYLSLFVCLIGLIVFALAAEGTTRSKVATLAKDMFWCGLLAFLLIYARVISVVR